MLIWRTFTGQATLGYCLNEVFARFSRTHTVLLPNHPSVVLADLEGGGSSISSSRVGGVGGGGGGGRGEWWLDLGVAKLSLTGIAMGSNIGRCS
jgi:hypothetical protein